MSITIFKDADANAIFVETQLGGRFLNSLQAYAGPTGGESVCDLTRSSAQVGNFNEFFDVPYTEFVNESGTAYGNDTPSTVNALNAVFATAGSTSNPPSITSPTTINAVTGQVINYELTSDFGVAHEWVNGLPAGLATVDGNERKAIGSIGVAGVYTAQMRAINYFGTDTQTLTINVSNPPFSNTKSVQFNQNDFLNAASAATMNATLGRAGNGSGAGDAWSVAFWFKPGTSGNNNQTILYAGPSTYNSNAPIIQVKHQGGAPNRNLALVYGTGFNNLVLATPAQSLTQNTWHHVLITYDGGTTGASAGSINAYFGRFAIFIDGAQVATTNSHSNFGYSGALNVAQVRVGRLGTGSAYLRNNSKVDELALWDSDQSANIAAIYNAGVPHDLALLAPSPVNWWRMGDGDAFPTLQDSAGPCDFTMNNMTAADIVSDVPV